MELKDYRNKLDTIDGEILALFRERMETVEAIAAYKKAHSLPVLVPGREQEILDRVRASSSETLAPYAAQLFETLMSLSREYQKTMMDD